MSEVYGMPNRRWDEGMSDDEKERRRERARQWNRANRDRAEAGNRAYRRRHRDRQNARNAVMVALRRGELTKQPCEVCGDPDVEAHHDDYAKRLDVRWLCRPHHTQADVKRRAAA